MRTQRQAILQGAPLLAALAARPSAIVLSLLAILSLAGCGADVGVAAATTAGLQAQGAKNAAATQKMALEQINASIAKDAARAADASKQAQAQADGAGAPADASSAMKAAEEQTK